MAKAYKEICPCKDCKERVVCCHSTCDKYKKWKESGIEIEKKPFFERKKGEIDEQ